MHTCSCIVAGASPTAEAIRQRSAPGTMIRPLARPEEMLYYMGDVLCFKAQFTDFPKVRPSTGWLAGWLAIGMIVWLAECQFVFRLEKPL